MIGPCVQCGQRTVTLTRPGLAYHYECTTCHLSITSWTWQELVKHVLTVANVGVEV